MPLHGLVDYLDVFAGDLVKLGTPHLSTLFWRSAPAIPTMRFPDTSLMFPLMLLYRWINEADKYFLMSFRLTRERCTLIWAR